MINPNAEAVGAPLVRGGRGTVVELGYVLQYTMRQTLVAWGGEIVGHRTVVV